MNKANPVVVAPLHPLPRSITELAKLRNSGPSSSYLRSLAQVICRPKRSTAWQEDQNILIWSGPRISFFDAAWPLRYAPRLSQTKL